MTQPIVYLTRAETLSASHRLHSTRLSDEQNRETFGKCNHPAGHGHNYRVEVTVRGPVDPVTGMVVNIEILKGAFKHIMDLLDHRNVDVDVPYFKNVVSTTENLCVFVWNEIGQNLGSHRNIELFEVKIYETDKNWAVYRGETN